MSGEPSDAADLPDVCVVTHPLSAAGENATRTLLEILAELTAVSLICADLPADSSIRDDHEVVEVTSAGAAQSNVALAAARFALNQLRMCREIVRRDEPVVLFYGATAYVLPISVARLAGKTVVVEPRGDVPLTLRLNWERQLPDVVAAALAGAVRALELVGYSLAHAVVAYTPGMARELGLDRFEHKLFATGARYVDTDHFRPRTPFEERPRRVGFVGRLDEEKGVRTLARVAARLPEDVTFRFVGDGPLREWLETELSEEVERGAVEFAGWVDHEDVAAELDQLRLLVLASRPTEGLPTSVLEAMACGVPVCAPAVSGVPDVVRPDDTGLLLESVDAAEITDAVRAALDDGDLPRTSANARRLVEDEYSFDAAVGRYREILSALAAGD